MSDRSSPGISHSAPPNKIDIGRLRDGAVRFENWRGDADRPEPPPPAPLPPDRRVGFALIGLGRLTLGQILPAFAHCHLAKPVALVPGTPGKARAVAAQYGIAERAVLGYGEINQLADDCAIAAVYVVAACDAAGVKLMIAYRCQYETYNREVIRLVRSGALGRVSLVEATNTQVQGSPEQWRMRAGLAGGGALPDIGLYCLNGARAMLGEEPVEVFARVWSPVSDARYAEVEETVALMLRFPSGAIANCAARYGAHETKDLRLRVERGLDRVGGRIAYQGQRLRIAHRDGSRESIDEKKLGLANQFALEIDHFAKCILDDRWPRTPGEEGVQDHVLMEAIYRSAREGGPVALDHIVAFDRFRGPALEG